MVAPPLQQRDGKLFLAFLKVCLDSPNENSFISFLFPKASALCWHVNPGFVITWTGKRSELALFLNPDTLMRAGDKDEKDGAAGWLWKINVFVQKALFCKPLSFLDTTLTKISSSHWKS